MNIASYSVKNTDMIEVNEIKKLTVIDGALQSKERCARIHTVDDKIKQPNL